MAVHVDDARVDANAVACNGNHTLNVAFRRIARIAEDNDITAFNRLQLVDELVDEDPLLVLQGRHHAGTFHLYRLIEKNNKECGNGQRDDDVPDPGRTAALSAVTAGGSPSFPSNSVLSVEDETLTNLLPGKGTHINRLDDQYFNYSFANWGTKPIRWFGAETGLSTEKSLKVIELMSPHVEDTFGRDRYPSHPGPAWPSPDHFAYLPATRRHPHASQAHSGAWIAQGPAGCFRLHWPSFHLVSLLLKLVHQLFLRGDFFRRRPIVNRSAFAGAMAGVEALCVGAGEAAFAAVGGVEAGGVLGGGVGWFGSVAAVVGVGVAVMVVAGGIDDSTAAFCLCER